MRKKHLKIVLYFFIITTCAIFSIFSERDNGQGALLQRQSSSTNESFYKKDNNTSSNLSFSNPQGYEITNFYGFTTLFTNQQETGSQGFNNSIFSETSIEETNSSIAMTNSVSPGVSNLSGNNASGFSLNIYSINFNPRDKEKADKSQGSRTAFNTTRTPFSSGLGGQNDLPFAPPNPAPQPVPLDSNLNYILVVICMIVGIVRLFYKNYSGTLKIFERNLDGTKASGF